MNSFAWTSFYMEFADRLLQYKDKRPELLTLLKEVYDNLGLRYPFMDKSGQPLDGICPFTVFGCFNKGVTTKNRTALADAIGSKIGVKAAVPTGFDGIPVLNNMKAWFFTYEADQEEYDISNLWSVFEAAINYADHQSDITKAAFIDCYNKVSKQHGVGWNLTLGLYWIRPFFYLNLDVRNRSYLLGYGKSYFLSIAQISNLKQLPDAGTYLTLIATCQNVFEKEDTPHHNFPELSYEARIASITKTYEKRYWIFTPGDRSSKWDDFYSQGIMGIGWDEMDDLKQYPSKDAMKSKMKELYGADYSYKMSGHATWQFANEIQIGDIVYAKKGLYKVIGRGIVESDYIFYNGRDEYKHIHKIKWTHNGEWEHPGQAVVKTLTDITPYTDYVRKLEALFTVDDNDDDEEKEVIYPAYTEDDFLSEVFLDAERYNELVNLLRTKKNIILQGAPGVGKTFAAKRLAFSIMGEKDTSRVMMVQFHQSYSYEDFIMGFRPSKDGYELTPGPFYEFCKTAQNDDEREYFFIIDEINRGNLSKIFGELLMLIEKDKRGEKLRLLYSNELFSVPQNVYLIGMMNTADRSIAIIDYALRRRFAFFELEPAFNSEGFKTIMREANNSKFDALVEQIKALNEFISRDESLGEGFRIGHSYFCTNDEMDEITDEWLRAVVKYELLPLLSEYWFDEKSKIEQWTKRLCNMLND
ncbi:MAG: AAA family ATPase [Clostridia bacterium]|nr:AAA family ATPase [Clostridia bacterium]